VTWRSQASILEEARALTLHPRFKGIIQDVGGPTANMYGIECTRKEKEGGCPDRRCLFPKVCAKLPVNHAKQMALLRALRAIKGIKKVVVASGIRHDLVLADKKHGTAYLREVVRYHVSGQLKMAPEHSEPHVLRTMGKAGREELLKFKNLFETLATRGKTPLFLTYYLIAAHPGCTEDDMRNLRAFALRDLRLLPEQIQIFTPTPSTYSTLMYWTERDSFTGSPCFVEKTVRGRERQKQILTDRGRVNHSPQDRRTRPRRRRGR